jgi:hypothetical protein
MRAEPSGDQTARLCIEEKLKPCYDRSTNFKLRVMEAHACKTRKDGPFSSYSDACKHSSWHRRWWATRALLTSNFTFMVDQPMLSIGRRVSRRRESRKIGSTKTAKMI